jgi:hypothetical protein
MTSRHLGPAPRTTTAGTTAPGVEPGRLAGLLARAWLEVRARRRPLTQLSPLVAPAVLRRLAVQIAPADQARCIGPARVRRVTVSQPTEVACEAVVLVDQGERTTAIAVRLERHHGRWRAVDLAAPEAGLPALRTASCPVRQRRPDAFDEVLAEVGEDA